MKPFEKAFKSPDVLEKGFISEKMTTTGWSRNC